MAGAVFPNPTGLRDERHLGLLLLYNRRKAAVEASEGLGRRKRGVAGAYKVQDEQGGLEDKKAITGWVNAGNLSSLL